MVPGGCGHRGHVRRRPSGTRPADRRQRTRVAPRPSAPRWSCPRAPAAPPESPQRSIQAEAVDPDALRTIVAAQATDAVSELLRWPTGDFGLVEAANPDDIGVLIPTETLVSEAISRGAAWESLAEILPSPDVVLALRPVAPEEDVVLKPDEWSLVALVDGRRSVGTIVALTGRGQFSVASALANLVRRGLLHQRGAQDAVADLEAPLALLVPLEASAESLLESLASSTPDETDSWAVTATPAQPAAPTAEQPQPVSSGSGLFSTPVPTVPAPADADHDADEVDDLPVTSMTLALTKVGGDTSTDVPASDRTRQLQKRRRRLRLPPATATTPRRQTATPTDAAARRHRQRRHRQRRHRRRRGRRGRGWSGPAAQAWWGARARRCRPAARRAVPARPSARAPGGHPGRRGRSTQQRHLGRWRRTRECSHRRRSADLIAHRA